MANLIESAKTEAQALIEAAAKRAFEAGLLPEFAELTGSVQQSRGGGNGDFAANHAMAFSKNLKLPKAELDAELLRIAAAIADNLELKGSYFDSAAVAGKGFINFSLSDRWYGEVVSAIASEGTDYGRVDIGGGERVMVEFVSANPTGPMTIGNARGGVLGDALASVFERAGYNVWREFYINDVGNQVELFGQSVEARYMQILLGEDGFEFPENGYHGEDIKELARLIYERDGDKYRDWPETQRRAEFIAFAIPYNIEQMREHLKRYRIEYDCWFPESSLHESGYVEDTINLLTEAGYTYEKDGALWLRNTEFGADKDEVLRRSNGNYTYYAPDIAYHRNKFVVRGFDRVIDVWGADHHGHAVRFKRTMSAPGLGLEGKQLDFLIMQMVRLHRGEETVKVSKRTGKALTLDSLLDEIGVDACRFFFNAKPDSHLDFDLDLAIRQDNENPVYYVQYAHARICSLIEMLASDGYSLPDEIDAALLNTEYERELIKQLAALPEEIRQAAQSLDPSRINRYVIELASRFHSFYTFCRIRGEETALLNARLKLAACVRTVIAASLDIVGVSAPVKM